MGTVPFPQNQKPLAQPQPISQPQPIAQPKTIATTTRSESPLSFILKDKEAREQDRLDNEKLNQKYASINSLKKDKKIEALKNINLNPYRLNDPYDGLANSLHRWTRVANDAVLNHYTDEQKNTIASNYYDAMVAPLYGNMGAEPMKKDLWMKQAFREAVNYNIEDAYNNSIIHGMKHGWDSGVAATARAYGYMADQLGNIYDNAVGQWRKSREVGKKYDTDNNGWNQNLGKLNNEKPIEDKFMAISRPKGLVERGNLEIWDRPKIENADGTHSSEYSVSFEDDNGHEVLVPTIVNGKFLTPDGKKPVEGSSAEKKMFENAWQNYLKTGQNLGKFDTPENADAYSQILHNRGDKSNQSNTILHVPGAVSRGASIQDANHQFWADALPNHSWGAKATSFIAEQAGQLPVYAAMAMGTQALGAVPGVANLTKILNATPVGKKVFQYLMAGTEGLAYGKLTRPQEDKGQAWRDAVGFMVFHGVFDIAGMGLKKAIDIAGPKDFDKMKARQDRLDLAAEGKRPATPTEVYGQHKTEVGNNLAVMGVEGQRQVYIDALHHVEDIEGRGWTRDQIRDHELKMMNADPARFGPMLSSAKYIRSLLSATGKKLGEIQPGSEEEKFLSSRLARLIIDAGSEMNQNVEGMKEEIQKGAEKQAKEPSAKNTIDFYRAKVAAQLAKENPAVAKLMKPEELEQLAVKAMAKDQEKAAKIGEDEISKEKTEEASNIAKRRKAETTPAVREKTKRSTDKFGQPAVSYSINTDYKVQLRNYIKRAKDQGMSLTTFFKEMSDEDFNADLSTHFYPKALRDAGVFFEHQNSREGVQNPNFMGFMYNYIDQMPREFGKELEDRLIGTMKMQKFMSGRSPSEPQLMYFAKAMYNHMDNFLASGRWPKESNIFRSTQDTMWQSTQWQQQLLREKMVEESKNLKEMFSGQPKAAKAAKTAYNLLAKQRLAEYAKKPKLEHQERISEIDTSISDILTSTGDRERIPF